MDAYKHGLDNPGSSRGNLAECVDVGHDVVATLLLLRGRDFELVCIKML